MVAVVAPESADEALAALRAAAPQAALIGEVAAGSRRSSLTRRSVASVCWMSSRTTRCRESADACRLDEATHSSAAGRYVTFV